MAKAIKSRKAVKVLKDGREVMPVPLNPDIRLLIESDVSRGGMTKTNMVARVLTWYAEQSDVIRSAILGTLPNSVLVDIAKITLERIASGRGSPKN